MRDEDIDVLDCNVESRRASRSTLDSLDDYLARLESSLRFESPEKWLFVRSEVRNGSDDKWEEDVISEHSEAVVDQSELQAMESDDGEPLRFDCDSLNEDDDVSSSPMEHVRFDSLILVQDRSNETETADLNLSSRPLEIQDCISLQCLQTMIKGQDNKCQDEVKHVNIKGTNSSRYISSGHVNCGYKSSGQMNSGHVNHGQVNSEHLNSGHVNGEHVTSANPISSYSHPLHLTKLHRQDPVSGRNGKNYLCPARTSSHSNRSSRDTFKDVISANGNDTITANDINLAKILPKRHKIIQELLDTETTYQRHLQLAVKVAVFLLFNFFIYLFHSYSLISVSNFLNNSYTMLCMTVFICWWRSHL